MNMEIIAALKYLNMFFEIYAAVKYIFYHKVEQFFIYCIIFYFGKGKTKSTWVRIG